MGNRKLAQGALAATGLAALLFGAVVIGADAKGGTTSGAGTDTKQNVMLPMQCDNGSNLQAGYNKSGNNVLLGILGSGVNADSSWSGDAVDGAMVRSEGPTSGTDWTILDGYSATKGRHDVVITMSDGSDSCTITLSFKV